MPVVKVHTARGKSADQKVAVAARITESIVDSFHLKASDITQLWFELQPHEMVGKGEAFVYVEVLALAGRSNDAKRKLYRRMVDGICAALPITPTDVLVQLFDIPKENCGTRGGQMAADLDLGFKIEV